MAEARQLSLQAAHLPDVVSNDRFKHVVDITQHAVQMTFLQEGTVVFVPNLLTLMRSLVRSMCKPDPH